MADHRFSRSWRRLTAGDVARRCVLWLTQRVADSGCLDITHTAVAFTTIVPAPSTTTTTSAASAVAVLAIAVARCCDTV